MYCVADISTEAAIGSSRWSPQLIAGSVYLGYEYDRWPRNTYCTFNLVRSFID